MYLKETNTKNTIHENTYENPLTTPLAIFMIVIVIICLFELTSFFFPIDTHKTPIYFTQYFIIFCTLFAFYISCVLMIEYNINKNSKKEDGSDLLLYLISANFCEYNFLAFFYYIFHLFRLRINIKINKIMK
jgi:hypothetical protein